MSQKYVVVQGAMCKCKFGNAPDALKVNSHQKYYANDTQASQKLIATTMELGGGTFQANTFGLCKLQPTGNSYKPCQIVVTQWKGFYKNADLGNGGHVLVEDSKAICPIAGSPCIQITNHGQSMAGSAQNAADADADAQRQINPMVDTRGLNQEAATVQEVTVI